MKFDVRRLHPFVRYARVLEIAGGGPVKRLAAPDSRLFYASRGLGYIETGGNTYKMDKGALLIWCAGLPYRVFAPEGGFVAFLAFNFDFTMEFAHLAAPIEPRELPPPAPHETAPHNPAPTAPHETTPYDLRNLAPPAPHENTPHDLHNPAPPTPRDGVPLNPYEKMPPNPLTNGGGAALSDAPLSSLSHNPAPAAPHETAPLNPLTNGRGAALSDAPLSPGAGEMPPLYIKSTLSEEGALRLAIREFEGGAPYAGGIISAALSGVICECLRAAAKPQGEIDKAKQTAGGVLKYIRENLDKALTNAKIAANFGLHPNYLNSIVSAETGMGIRQNIIGLRLEKAVSLLITTQQSIWEIAAQAGFGDLAHFSKCFKRRLGISPANFRRENQSSAL